MNKVTDFLKQITIDKKNQGIQYAIENLRDFIKKNSLTDETLLRCVRRICRFILERKSNLADWEKKQLEDYLENSVFEDEVKYEYYRCLADLYEGLGRYEESYQMVRGAISCISPYDYSKPHKLSSCFFQDARLLHKNKTIRPKDNLVGFLYLIKSRIYEVVCEINSALFGYPERITGIKEKFFNGNYEFEIELYDSFLADLELLNKKQNIEFEILDFINNSLLKSMKIDLSNNETLSIEFLKNCTLFEDDEIVYKFCDDIAKKYILNKKTMHN